MIYIRFTVPEISSPLELSRFALGEKCPIDGRGRKERMRVRERFDRAERLDETNLDLSGLFILSVYLYIWLVDAYLRLSTLVSMIVATS